MGSKRQAMGSHRRDALPPKDRLLLLWRRLRWALVP